jgi:hypothetical protein
VKLIYLGSEVPSNRTLLGSANVQNMGLSYWRLVKRGLPKTKSYLIENYFDESVNVFVHPGIPKNMIIGRTELEEFAANYEEFVVENIDRINTFTEIDNHSVSPDFVRNQRETVWAEMPPAKFLPVWSAATGQKGLAELTAKYLDIAISGEAIEANSWLASATRTYGKREGSRFHGLGLARPDNSRQVPLESVTTLSWLSPMLHGETIIWDGSQLVRYPKDMKDQARARHKTIIETKAGLNYDLILQDDAQEVCRLALWSFDQLEMKMTANNNNLYDSFDDPLGEDYAETTPSIHDRKGVEMRKLLAREESEMGNLPVFGYELKTEIDPDGTIKDVQTVHSQQVSLRVCDTCFVAANCPAFKPQSVCSFKLPVEVKTKDQLKSLINAVIEMQGQRVAFMRFAEEMNGGYADPNLSQEIDRLFKLMKTTKELDDSREFIRMTVERQGGAGVLSQIFGDKANVLKEIPNGGLSEEQTTQIIKNAIED